METPSSEVIQDAAETIIEETQNEDEDYTWLTERLDAHAVRLEQTQAMFQTELSQLRETSQTSLNSLRETVEAQREMLETVTTLLRQQMETTGQITAALALSKLTPPTSEPVQPETETEKVETVVLPENVAAEKPVTRKRPRI